jgi:hypothetical protein
MNKKIVVMVLALAVWLSACTPDAQPATYPAPTAGEQTTDAYPRPTVELYVPPEPQTYPAPAGDVPLPTPFTIPEPGANTGVVTGRVLDVDSGGALGNLEVYLGYKNYLTPEPGAPAGAAYTYEIQRNSSPHIFADEQGRFALGEVPPGEYILIVFTPNSISVAFEQNSDMELAVIVEAGKVLDLGDVPVTNPYAGTSR